MCVTLFGMTTDSRPKQAPKALSPIVYCVWNGNGGDRREREGSVELIGVASSGDARYRLPIDLGRNFDMPGNVFGVIDDFD